VVPFEISKEEDSSQDYSTEERIGWLEKMIKPVGDNATDP
jgi:hypothetical protein